MCMFLFNIFNESKEGNHITTMLTYLDTNPLLFITNFGFLKLEKPLTYPKTPIYIFGNIF